MKGMRDLMDAGVTRVSAHQLMLLHGAPLSNPESRQKFGMKTMVRVVARDIGNYTGEPVIETEEMVVSTPEFSFEEYLQVRVFHLLLTIFYYESNFEEAFELAREHGVKAFDLVVKMQSMLDQAPAGFQRVIEDFVKESREELFPTRKQCIEWARQNLDALVGGELGGNLLSKYSMIGRFYATGEALDFLRDVLAANFGEPLDTDWLEQIDSVIEYLRCVLLHTPFNESLQAAPVWSSAFDLETWRNEKYSKLLSVYRHEQPRRFATVVEPERKTLIENRIQTFGEHPSGLGKFTRTMFARDLRRTVFAASTIEPTPRADSIGLRN
jgi:hypothetical protein